MINYVNGDATKPQGEGPKFILHVVNTVGLWGAGFVLALSNRWSEPEEAYYATGEKPNGYSLGSIEPVKVADDLWVINMVGQSGVGSNNGRPPIRYNAIERCLERVAGLAKSQQFRGLYKSVHIHAPRFGAGLAGGDWNRIEEIINHTLVEKDIPVTIYDFKG